MKSYLLFDSGCSTCSALAQEIAEEAGDRLAVQSLRNSDMQALLSQANPNWRWEPCLLEVSDEKVRVYTGIAMRARLALRLGPRRTRRVMSLVYRYAYAASRVDAVPSGIGRRQFLQQSGLSLAGLLFLIGAPRSRLLGNLLSGGRLPETEQTWPANQVVMLERSVAEIFEGFLILPEEEGVPSFVQRPAKGIPQLCGIGDTPTSGSIEYHPHFEEFLLASGLPVFTLEDIEQRLSAKYTSKITRYESGEVFFAMHQVHYEELNAMLSLSIQTNFPIPYPVYIIKPVEEGRKAIVPEKVDFLPSPGLTTVTEHEIHSMWIQSGLLYSIHLNRVVDFRQLGTLVQSLVIRTRN